MSLQQPIERHYVTNIQSNERPQIGQLLPLRFGLKIFSFFSSERAVFNAMALKRQQRMEKKNYKEMVESKGLH